MITMTTTGQQILKTMKRVKVEVDDDSAVQFDLTTDIVLWLVMDDGGT